MARPLLTVLTTPIQRVERRAYQGLRRAVRPLVKPGVPLPKTSPYPGHFAVVRSVVEGLRAIDADFNFNPRRFRELGRVVYAPANEALRQAAVLKRQGKVEYLIAGPVNALVPSEGNGILLMPEIDRLIVACDWICDVYRIEAPELLPKLRVCPAGVDAEYWKPSAERLSRTTRRAVVYWKSGSEAFCEDVEQVVRRCGLEPVRVRARHGEHTHYHPARYRHVLDEAVLGVFLSSFETQGLALLEAWSMDVPTIVWNPCGEAEWRGHTFYSGSSCPYLTPVTGRTWQTLDELESVMRDALRSSKDFHAREWVLSHMTDAVCSAALYRTIQEGVEGRVGGR